VADPLATQVWKAYAKAKDGLPNGPRMENLTWRLMHLTLKKQEEEQGAAGMSKSAGTSRGFQAGSLDTVREEKSGNSPAAQEEHGSRESSGEIERGRSKGKSRVVGFHNAASPQDPQVEDG
jgi:GATA-binding protein